MRAAIVAGKKKQKRVNLLAPNPFSGYGGPKLKGPFPKGRSTFGELVTDSEYRTLVKHVTRKGGPGGPFA